MPVERVGALGRKTPKPRAQNLALGSLQKIRVRNCRFRCQIAPAEPEFESSTRVSFNGTSDGRLNFIDNHAVSPKQGLV
jgi:hypothetical protein